MKTILSCLVPIIILISCGKKREETRATIETITESVYASGVVKSMNQYQVVPTVSGIITEIPVVEGQHVKKGDVIIRIDDATAKLNRENAKLAAEFADVNTNSDRLLELKTNLDLAKNKMDNDSLLYERQKKLHEQNIGTQVEFEQRRLAFLNSKSNWESYILKYRDLKRQIEFSSSQSKNNLQISSTLTDDYNIRSLIDGKVYGILREKGEMVNSQIPIAIIGDDSTFYLELQIDEYDISKVKTGQEAIISMDSYMDKIFNAVITKVNPIMNERSKTFTVEASFNTRPETLYPNLTAEANIVIQTKKNVITIPRDYLINDSFVVLKDDNKKKVTTGLRDYQKVEIKSGLEAGQVILKPE